MTEKEILEGNKLIAEFMGLQPNDDKTFWYDPLPANKGHKDLHYHISWDWLMPVVEKIETDASQETGHCEFHITKNHSRIYRMSYTKELVKSFNPKSKILSVWETVVKYIHWYTNQNKK